MAYDQAVIDALKARTGVADDDIISAALDMDAEEKAMPRNLDYSKERGLRQVVGNPAGDDMSGPEIDMGAVYQAMGVKGPAAKRPAVEQEFAPNMDAIFAAMKLPEEKPQQGSRLKDLAIDIARAPITLGQTITGIGSLATGGKLGEALDAIGYNPKAAHEFLSDFYSPQRKEANAAVAETAKQAEADIGNAQGVGETSMAALKGAGSLTASLFKNPSVIQEQVIQSLPDMLFGAGIVGKAGKLIFLSGAEKVGIGAERAVQLLAGAAPATEAEIGAIKAGQKAVELAQTKLSWLGHGIEGTQAAGQNAEQIREANPNNLEGQYAQIPAGILTALIGRAASKVPGFGDVETAAALKLAGVQGPQGVLGATGNIGKRVAKGMFSEGVLQELPQSAQEQIWQNLGDGKPWNEGVFTQGIEGMVTGAAMGGGHAAIANPVSAPTENPTAQAQEPPRALPLYAGSGQGAEPLVVFPDGSTMTRAEAEQQRFGAMVQPADKPLEQQAGEILSQPTVDAAIAAAESSTQEFGDFLKQEQIDAAFLQRAAIEQTRKANEMDSIRRATLAEEADVAPAITLAQGFGEPAPTAIQLAWERAKLNQQRRNTNGITPAETIPTEAPGTTPEAAIRRLRVADELRRLRARQATESSGVAPGVVAAPMAVAPKPTATPPERRHISRMRVSEMTPEQMSKALLTSNLMDLPNGRAFGEHIAGHPEEHVLSGDLDDFKALNDKLTHEGADSLLGIVGEIKKNVARQFGVNPFHRSGDEFLATHAEPAILEAYGKSLQDLLSKTTFKIALPNGEEVEQKGVGFSYGTGRTEFDAEAFVKRQKDERKAAGLRTGQRDAVQPVPAGRESDRGNPAGRNEDRSAVPVTEPEPKQTPAQQTGVFVSAGQKADTEIPERIARDNQTEAEVVKAKSALDAAGISGTERANTIAAVRRGELTAEDVAESYPMPDEETASGQSSAPAPEADNVQAAEITHEKLARIFDQSRWLDRGLKIRAATRLYRGEDQNTGSRVGNEGRGLYVTTDKTQAEGYGQVREMPHSALPKYPIRFRDVATFNEWRRFVARELGFGRESEFEKVYGSNADEWIRRLDPSVDGIQIGVGHGAFFVKFPPVSDPIISTENGGDLAAEEGALLSRGEEPAIANPISEQQFLAKLPNQVRKAVEVLRNSGKLEFVSAEDANARIGESAVVQSHFGRALAFYLDGVTHIIPENIPATITEQAAFGLMRHELGVHALQLGKESKEFQGILRSLDLMIRGGNKQAVAANDRAMAAGASEANRLEEALGYLVEAAPSASLVQRFLTWFKQQVNRLIGGRWQYTPGDLVAMAESALRGSASNDIATSREDANYLPSQARRDWYYSQLADAINAVPAKLSTGNEIALWLKSNAGKLGVKKEEIEWSGITDYLAMRGKERVSKDEIRQFLSENGVQIKDVVLGGSKSIDTLVDERVEAELASIADDADSEYWTELIADQASKEGKEVRGLNSDERGDILDRAMPRGERIESVRSDLEQNIRGAARDEIDGTTTINDNGRPKFDKYTLPGGENYKELLITLPTEVRVSENASWDELRSAQAKADANERRFGNFRSSHFDQPNILAHIRMNERTDADGKRVLFIEEIQSDFGQSFKKQKDHINNAVDNHFLAIIENMKSNGVLEVNCD